ncbi:MAG: DNA repair protein RecN [Gammaproteobacteria bacterium]|nr:DNA repair protein RecN [Gammaproteobacteria bacterium]
MLTSVHIRHLVTIDELSLDLDSGMSALTGETGAGKSILIDSLGLALGNKADISLIRSGHEKAEITAAFDLADNTEAKQWLREQELLDESCDCLVRRVLTMKGRSRAFINNTPVTLASLTQLGEKLVDIHGQHAHQSLLKAPYQRALLDAYAGNEKLLNKLQHQWRQWNTAARELSNLQMKQQDRRSHIELLRFQIDELENLAVEKHEWRQLESEQRRLSNAGLLRERCEELLNTLYHDNGVTQLLQRSISILEELRDIDKLPGDSLEMLQSAKIEVEESSHTLHQYAEDIQLDPARLASVDQRLSSILLLARKHQLEPAELPLHLSTLQQQLAKLLQSDEQLDILRQQVDEHQQQWEKLAGRLSRSRRKAVGSLAAQVSTTMQLLSMPDGRFSVKLDSIEQQQPTAHGVETIEFYFSANPGQPQQPLSKAASGGELSRISLAIQVATIGLAKIPTLIFDEVDVGIGGGVAEIVGKLLRKLGEERQVLCVTHLPQVAAQAHHHLLVEKQRHNNSTQTRITPLEEGQRVDEVARMLGGVEMTERTLEHAQEMLST